MYASRILRSTVSLGSQVSKQQAVKHVNFRVNTSALSTYSTLYAKKIPVFFQWGVLLTTVLGWPLAFEHGIRSVGGMNAVSDSF